MERSNISKGKNDGVRAISRSLTYTRIIYIHSFFFFLNFPFGEACAWFNYVHGVLIARFWLYNPNWLPFAARYPRLCPLLLPGTNTILPCIFVVCFNVFPVNPLRTTIYVTYFPTLNPSLVQSSHSSFCSVKKEGKIKRGNVVACSWLRKRGTHTDKSVVTGGGVSCWQRTMKKLTE